jgi:hypothetical protein
MVGLRCLSLLSLGTVQAEYTRGEHGRVLPCLDLYQSYGETSGILYGYTELAPLTSINYVNVTSRSGVAVRAGVCIYTSINHVPQPSSQAPYPYLYRGPMLYYSH